jgi:multidrug efflux pump subunit AcrA (membrane-fusion protein)
MLFGCPASELICPRLHHSLPRSVQPVATCRDCSHSIAAIFFAASCFATLFGGRAGGYSANADIVVKQKKDVLLLPERLVKFEGGKATVEIPGDLGKEPTKKEIKYGLSDGMNVEVTEGLKEKDAVVERPPKKIE